MEKSQLAKLSLEKLQSYCENESYKGWDPFDGLNSRLFSSLPFFKHSKIARLIFLQFTKRSFINFRRLFLVEKEYNAKGIALFLSGYCKLYGNTPDIRLRKKIKFLADKLLSLRSRDYSGSCWGYNFDWQARAFFQPRLTPTIVATTYCVSALIDSFEVLQDEKYLRVALDSQHFVLKDLNRSPDETGDFAFSYSPLDTTQIFNASLLASRLLSAVYLYDKNDELIDAAKTSISFCCKHQKDNGAWSYGTLPFHDWIDNFHTGYNLECIFAYQEATNDFTYSDFMKKGMEFYAENFFSEKGIPRYYHNHTYPVDLHNTAQLIITASRLGEFDARRKLIDLVLLWTINNMQDESGYFFYQKRKYYTNKIPYMRWTQAWMFYGLSAYIAQLNEV